MTRNEAKDRVVDAARKLSSRMVDTEAHGADYDMVDREWQRLTEALVIFNSTPDSEGGWRRELGFGEIVMVSEQRNKPGLPPRWCALARGRKEAAYADSEEEARIAALLLPPAAPETRP